MASTYVPDPGSPPPLSLALLGRYFRTQWQRAFGLNVTKIDQHLLLGGQFQAEQWPALHALGVRAVLSLQGEREDTFCAPLPNRTLRLEVEDFYPPTIEQLEEAVAFLRVSRERGEPTLIHCHAGIGRAPLTTIAFLVSEGMDVQQAHALVYARRPIIRLNRRQRTRLLEWVIAKS